MAARLPAAALLKAKATSRSRPMPALPSRRRFAKNMLAVCGAMSLGDFGCQRLEWWDTGEEFEWDHKRSMRMGFTGAFVVTPMSFTWNLFAEWWAPGTTWKAICKKQLVAASVTLPMLYAQFFSLTMLEEGKTLQDFHQRVERDCLPTFMRGLCYWPLVGVVNFKFVPVVNRPGVSSIAGLFWSIYLSHRANSEMEDDDMVEVVETLGRATVVRPLEESARPSSAAAAAIAPAMAAEPLSPADVGNEPSPSSSDIAVLAGGLAGGSVAGSDARRGKEARAAGVVGGVTATDRRGVVDVRGANGVVGAVATAEAEAAAKAGEAGETTPGRTRRKRKVVRRTTVVSY